MKTFNRETQLQRVVRKKRAGEWGGGTITIHFNGYAMDTPWDNKRDFMKAVKQLHDVAETLWEVIEDIKKIDDEVTAAVSPKPRPKKARGTDAKI